MIYRKYFCILAKKTIMIWKKLNIGNLEYLVSEFGSVKRLKFDGTYYHYKRNVRSDGYVSRGNRTEHIWVAMAFLDHTPNGHEIVVHHKDSNKENNHVSNLELITQSENVIKRNVGRSSVYPFVGYCDTLRRYKVALRAEGKPRYYGSFKNEDDAGRVAKVLVEIYRPELLKEFDKFNF